MWFYTGDKLKEILKIIPKDDKELYWVVINAHKVQASEDIWRDNTLTPQEKIERNIELVEEITVTAEEEEEESIASGEVAEIRKRIIFNRSVAGFMLLVDTLLVLLPAILMANGLTTASLASFGVLGVIGALNVSKKVQEQGTEITWTKNISIIIAYLLTQVPFFTIMFTGWTL